MDKNRFLDMAYVKATELNRGKASQYIKEVHDKNEDLLVLKNSSPYAVIISIERYNTLIKNYDLNMEDF